MKPIEVKVKLGKITYPELNDSMQCLYFSHIIIDLILIWYSSSKYMILGTFLKDELAVTFMPPYL